MQTRKHETEKCHNSPRRHATCGNSAYTNAHESYGIVVPYILNVSYFGGGKYAYFNVFYNVHEMYAATMTRILPLLKALKSIHIAAIEQNWQFRIANIFVHSTSKTTHFRRSIKHEIHP